MQFRVSELSMVPDGMFKGRRDIISHGAKLMSNRHLLCFILYNYQGLHLFSTQKRSTTKGHINLSGRLLRDILTNYRAACGLY